MSIQELFRLIILQNELSGNLSAALKFSNASKSSGLSFGVSQLDITHNPLAVTCLKECGFSPEEIQFLRSKPTNLLISNQKLKSHASIVAKYDSLVLSADLNSVTEFLKLYNLSTTNISAQLGLADYVNQYGSLGKESAAYYKSLGRPITIEDVLQFKLNHTQYGRENKCDCIRRYEGILKVVKEH